jgi:hypothetical protein
VGESLRQAQERGAAVGAVSKDRPAILAHAADPLRTLEKIDRAWEAMLEEIYNPIYGTSH